MKNIYVTLFRFIIYTKIPTTVTWDLSPTALLTLQLLLREGAAVCQLLFCFYNHSRSNHAVCTPTSLLHPTDMKHTSVNDLFGKSQNKKRKRKNFFAPL